MTVPFIMALGVGIASIRNDKHAGDDSFGLVALCSIGPILAVLILGLLYHTEGSAALEVVSEVENSIELGKINLQLHCQNILKRSLYPFSQLLLSLEFSRLFR